MTKEKRLRRRDICAFLSSDMDKELEALATGTGKSGKRRTRKRDGEAAEAAFLNKATSLGFEVAKPWGDSSQFDFILYTGWRCWRVQVKSTRCFHNQHYSVILKTAGRAYTRDDVDFVVVYLVPVDAWYVFPIEVVCGKNSITFSPRPGSRSRSEPYREAWCLMACPRDGKCNPEISGGRKCLASENGECPFQGCNPPTKLDP